MAKAIKVMKLLDLLRHLDIVTEASVFQRLRKEFSNVTEYSNGQQICDMLGTWATLVLHQDQAGRGTTALLTKRRARDAAVSAIEG